MSSASSCSSGVAESKVKVVYNGNAVNATREAFAQRFMHSDIYHANDAGAHKLALFSEDVGDWNVDFLQRYGIASV